MIKKQSSTLFAILCAALLTTTSSAAEEMTKNERAAVGARAESIESRITRFESDTEMASLMKNEVQSTGKPSSINNALSLPRGILSVSSHPDVYQNPVSITGNTVELMDGSIWEINPSDEGLINFWAYTDLIYITPNNSRFIPYIFRSSYMFRLSNMVTGDSVSVNLKMGPIAPIYNSIYTHWIKAIDYYYNLVYLEDGSVWNMSSWDSSVVQQWIPGDVMIIAVNDDWLFSYSKYVLINVATLNYAVAEIVNPF